MARRVSLIVGDTHRLRTRTHAGVQLRCVRCHRFLADGDTTRCTGCKVTYAEITDGVFEVASRGA